MLPITWTYKAKYSVSSSSLKAAYESNYEGTNGIKGETVVL